MAFTKKTLRFRGSKSCGRGFSRRFRSGSKGGVGNAGAGHHHKFRTIVQQKRRILNKPTINLKDIERSFETLLKKNYLTLNKRTNTYVTTLKFAHKYKKVLAEGELSRKVRIRTKASAATKIKVL